MRAERERQILCRRTVAPSERVAIDASARHRMVAATEAASAAALFGGFNRPPPPGVEAGAPPTACVELQAI